MSSKIAFTLVIEENNTNKKPTDGIKSGSNKNALTIMLNQACMRYAPHLKRRRRSISINFCVFFFLFLQSLGTLFGQNFKNISSVGTSCSDIDV